MNKRAGCLKNRYATAYISLQLYNTEGYSQGAKRNFTYLFEGKFILLLNCPLDVQYNNSECWAA